MTTSTATGITGILADPSNASLKRIAWAYGCARKGSDEEAKLLAVLLERAKAT